MMIKKLAPFLILLLAVGTAHAGNMRTTSGSGGGTITFKQGTISGSCDGIACSLRGDNLSGTCAQVAADNDGDLYCGTEDDVPESGDFTNLTGGNGIDQSAGTVAVDLYTGSGTTGATGSDSGLEFTSGKAGLLRGCADDEILKWDETEDDWNCEADLTLATIGNTSCWNESMVAINAAYYPNSTFHCSLGNHTETVGGGCRGTSYIGYGLLYPWDTKVRAVYCNFKMDMVCTGTCGAGGDDDEIIIQLRKGVRAAPATSGADGVMAESDFGSSCTLSATDAVTDHEKLCTMDEALPSGTILQLQLDGNNLPHAYIGNCSVTVCLNEEITGGGS